MTYFGLEDLNAVRYMQDQRSRDKNPQTCPFIENLLVSASPRSWNQLRFLAPITEGSPVLRTKHSGAVIMEWRYEVFFRICQGPIYFGIWRLLYLGCRSNLCDMLQPRAWCVIALPHVRVLTICHMKILTSKPHVFVPAFSNRKQVVNRLKIPQGLSTLIFHRWSEVPSRGGVRGDSL